MNGTDKFSRIGVWMFALLVFTCLGRVSAAKTLNFYVSTAGNDAFPGTLARPFKTLTRAQRAEEAAGTQLHRNIYIRGGRYYNVAMFLQGPGAGPGHDDSNCSWIGFPGDVPAALYGGQPLTGWQSLSNGWWRAKLPPYPQLNPSVNTLSNWEVRMLLVDGEMAERAQFPVNGSSLSYPNTAPQSDLSYINYYEGDIPAGMAATNAEVMIDWSYDSTTLGVSSINRASQTINFIGEVWGSRGLQYIPDIQTYRIYNTIEGLSHPGQFVFDRGSHEVIYYPLEHRNPNTLEIIAPTTDRMWLFYGYQGAPGPSEVTFSNLTMKVLAADRELEGNFGYLWNYMSLIHLADNSGPLDFSVEQCAMGWCAGNAIGGDFAFPTNATVENCDIGYCGGSGVVLRGGSHTIVSNNAIHDTGLITWQCPALRVCTNAVVIQNSFYNCRQSAIADHDVDDCSFIRNSFSNCMQRNEDMGAYYQYFGPNAVPHPHGNLLQSNLFRVVGTNFNSTGSDARNFYRPAMYLDEGSSNTVLADNITLSCPTPVFFNAAGSNAVVRNIFVNTNCLYVGLRFYSSAYSQPPNEALANLFLTSSNFVVDNEQLWSPWSSNLFWSTAGFNSGAPFGATVEDPMLEAYPAPRFVFGSGSAALGLGIDSVWFVGSCRGVVSKPALAP